ncbi:MAG: hypothetical protein ACRD1V_14560 [Vicinamibacterales bacterium]
MARARSARRDATSRVRPERDVGFVGMAAGAALVALPAGSDIDGHRALVRHENRHSAGSRSPIS